MGEVAKPDYLSLVNKGGSGFNVSELVTAIVASEIEPKRAIQTTKQEKTPEERGRQKRESKFEAHGFLVSETKKRGREEKGKKKFEAHHFDFEDERQTNPKNQLRKA